MKIHYIINISLSILLLVALTLTIYSLKTARSLDSEAKGPPSGKGRSNATLVLTPNPVKLYNTYTVSGSGFQASDWVSVGIKYPDATYWTTTTTDSAGSFSFTKTARVPGELVHEAYQQKNQRTWELKATVVLTVIAS